MSHPVPNSPISVRQQTANEKNAQLSTGPRTAAGIEACKHNRLSHGLASTLTVLPCEDQSQFDELLASFVQEHSPGTPTEQALVAQIVAAVWKLRRLGCIEESVFGLLLSAAPPTEGSSPYNQMALELTSNSRSGNALSLLARYQSALNRQLLQGLKELRTAQDRRRAARDQTEKQELLHRLSGNTERTHSQKHSLELLTSDPDIIMNYVEAEALVLAGIKPKALRHRPAAA
ncbi:MAG TPA: hypothetical protein VMZ52_14475 [Bryobacteraceae bacterium]|nr:hypothetical protein [Bryobacteraceae bacterium]